MVCAALVQWELKVPQIALNASPALQATSAAIQTKENSNVHQGTILSKESTLPVFPVLQDRTAPPFTTLLSTVQLARTLVTEPLNAQPVQLGTNV